METLRNHSYIFLPFLFEKNGDFAGGPEAFDDIIGKNLPKGNAPLDHMTSWKLSDTNIRKYMLKYIQDTFLTDDTRFRKMLMFEPVDIDKALISEGHIRTGQPLTFTPDDIRTDENCSEEYSFRILGANIYLFRTGVGIVCFETDFPESEYTYISTCEYFLQKVRSQQIPEIRVNKYNNSHTLLDLARSLTDSTFGDLGFRDQSSMKTAFFYYSKAGTERADFFTFLDIDDSSDPVVQNNDKLDICRYEKQLFYLDRCYKPSFSYIPGLSKNSVYQSAAGIFWGITQKCTVCIFNSKLEQATGQFRENLFNNFKDHYRFMYVLMLHQKYALHLYLSRRVPTDITPELDLKQLEKYQKQLYAFKTDFVFSSISEVEQYQNLYNRIDKAFALNEMYADVEEPLQKLDELEKKKAEEEQRKRDMAEHDRERKMNFMLAAIAVLSICSALKDSYDYFGDLINVNRPAFIAVFCIFAGIAMYIVHEWFK